MKKSVAFQGQLGAYSHQAVLHFFPEGMPFACHSFDDVFDALVQDKVARAVIPIENSTAGRVADIHRLLLAYEQFFITAEYFLPIRHCLLGLPEAKVSDIKTVHSHIQALSQCREHIKQAGYVPVTQADTAGSAKGLTRWNDLSCAAIAGHLAAEIYGLNILQEDFQDTDHNTTRFVVLSKENVVPSPEVACLTSVMFMTKNIPAALYKALGGFASNSLDLLKLESSILDGKFHSVQFYAEIAAHVDAAPMQNALKELAFFSKSVRVLGCYRQDEAFRGDA